MNLKELVFIMQVIIKTKKWSLFLFLMITSFALSFAQEIATTSFHPSKGDQIADTSSNDEYVKRKIEEAKAEKEIAKREAIYQELADLKNDTAVAFLSQAALTEPQPGTRIVAILALRKIGSAEALKGIFKVLEVEKHKGVRIQAVNSLGFFSEPEALSKLREVARKDPDKDLRISASMALSRLNDTQTLSDNFEVETDTAVKLGIIDALGHADSGENELKKIKAKSKDAKINDRINFYIGRETKKVKKK